MFHWYHWYNPVVSITKRATSRQVAKYESESMKSQRLVPWWSKMSEENKTEAKTPETHMVKKTFKIKQEVKHFSWRFLTEWSDLEASAVITTLRWPPSPEDTLEHPYKHPSVTATNESSVIFDGRSAECFLFFFPFLRSAVVLLIEQRFAGNMRHNLQVGQKHLNTQWDFLLLSTGAFKVHTVCLHPAQSQRPALSHQPSVVMNGLSPYRLRAAGAVWRTGQLNRWSPSASDPADNRSKRAYHYYYLMFHCIQITITKMARGTSRQVQLSSTWTVRLTQERL